MRTGRLLLAASLLVAAGLYGEAQRRSGLNLSTFDRAVRPQDDLYAHVNGAWLARTTLAPDRRRAGTVEEVGDRIAEQLRVLAEQPGKFGLFYATFIDEAAAERQGLQPLASELAAIEATSTRTGLAQLLARLSLLTVRAPLTPLAFPDSMRPDVFALVIAQGGLGLPNREYYVTDAPNMRAIREQYTTYLATLLALAGTPSAASAARDIVALETDLARAQWTAAQTRDVVKRYNPMPAAELAQRYPEIDWSAWFGGLGLDAATRPSVQQPSYIEALSRQLGSTPVERWRSSISQPRCSIDMRPISVDPFADAEFAFRGRVLNGVEQPEPRWRRALTSANLAMGHVVGEAYVARHFRPDTRARVAQLVENLRTAFGQAIDHAEWMSAATKQEARTKLAAFRANIGYPVTWRDYSGLDIRAGELAANMMRAMRFEMQHQLGRIGGPTDPEEWTMLPQVVNAQYSPRRNSITFPAGILQPPLFDPSVDDAVNYGAIGTVIGHEMGHGFDDQGRRTDAAGRLRDWWKRGRRRRVRAARRDRHGAVQRLRGDAWAQGQRRPHAR